MKIDSSFLRKNIGTESYFCQKGLLLERNRRCLVCFPIPVAFNTSPATAAAKSLQSCPTLCDPIDSSPPGSAVPGILQARTLEWVAISFSNAGKWKVKVKSLSLSDSYRPHGLQPTRLLHPRDFPGKSTGVGCHCLLWTPLLLQPYSLKTGNTRGQKQGGKVNVMSSLWMVLFYLWVCACTHTHTHTHTFTNTYACVVYLGHYTTCKMIWSKSLSVI